MTTCLVQVRLIIDSLSHCLQEMPVGEHSKKERVWAPWSDRPGFEASLCQLKTVGARQVSETHRSYLLNADNDLVLGLCAILLASSKWYHL